jgi:Holliday junction resolvase RusA-like endonuclease
MKFEIPGRLPGINEIIDAAKRGYRGYQPYADMKKNYGQMIQWLAKKMPQYEKVIITITWYEPNAKRDIDNIMGGQKFILDALVKEKVIPNDTQRYVNEIRHNFEVDRDNPRVEVEIVEI